MPFKVNCSSCSKKLTIPDKFAGRTVKCPACAGSVAVPTKSNSPEASKGRQPKPRRSDSSSSPFDFSTPTVAREPKPTPIGSSSSPFDFESSPSSPFDASPDLEPESEPTIPQLIACEACHHQIASTAAACPRCGAPNAWIHPEIQRFLESVSQFQNRPPFEYNHSNLTLSGSAKVSRGQVATQQVAIWILAIAVIAVIAGMVLPDPAGGVALGLGVIGFMAGSGAVCVSFLQPMKDTDFQTSFHIDFSTSPPRWRSDDNVFWSDVEAFFFGEQEGW